MKVFLPCLSAQVYKYNQRIVSCSNYLRFQVSFFLPIEQMVATDIKFFRCSSSGESSHFYLRLTLPLLNLLQLVKRFDNWRRGWDSFSPLVSGAHRLTPVATHALFLHRATTVLRSRPPSLPFVKLTLLPHLCAQVSFESLCV